MLFMIWDRHMEVESLAVIRIDNGSSGMGWGMPASRPPPPLTHTHSKAIGNCFVMLGLQYVRGFEGGGGGARNECNHRHEHVTTRPTPHLCMGNTLN